MLPIALINSSLILVFSLFSFFRKRPVWNQIVFYILLDHLILFRDKKLALHSTWVWNDAFVSGHTCFRGPRGRPDDVQGMHSFNILLQKNSITCAIFLKLDYSHESANVMHLSILTQWSANATITKWVFITLNWSYLSNFDTFKMQEIYTLEIVACSWF